MYCNFAKMAYNLSCIALYFKMVKILKNSAQKEIFGPVENSLLTKLALIGLA